MYVKVTVQPSSNKERVAKVGENKLEVMVKEPTRGNRANKRTREIVAELYHQPITSVQMVKGHRSRHKAFHIECTRDNKHT